MHRLLQLTLDLFEPVAQPAPPAAPPVFEPKQPLPGANKHADATESVASPAKPDAPAEPALPLSGALAPAVFTHPQANRAAVLAGTHVAYAFKRARRRNIGFLVGPEGLTVSAPTWVPLAEVESALRDKAGWIVRKLGEMRERERRTEAARIDWRDGAGIPFLGETVILVLDPRHASGMAALNTGGQALPGVPRLTLHLGLPHGATAQQIRDTVQAWLMRQATRLFTERLEHYAPRLGVRWTKLRLSSASTRWGTAHSDGTIRLNWRLIHFRLPVIDYVVAHELSHLRVMDHSPRFWDTVATVVPDHAALRRQLREQALPVWE